MQSTTSSTRTFMTTPPKESKPAKAPKPPKAPRQLPKMKVKVPSAPWLVVIALVLFSGFMFVQYQEAKHKLQGSTPSGNSKQVSDVVSKVGKLIILPKGETPTVATVLHASTLKSQPFFAAAKDGDKVIVYTKQKQAILYRPSTDQLVNVAPVTTTPNVGN